MKVCTGREGVRNQVSTVTAALPEDRICRLPVDVKTAKYPFLDSETRIFVENRTEQEICIPKQCALGTCRQPEDGYIQEERSVQHVRGKDKTPSSMEEKRKFIIDSFNLDQNKILNSDLKLKDAYPLPSITENLERLKGAKVFSSLDAAGAYHAVTIGGMP